MKFVRLDKPLALMISRNIPRRKKPSLMLVEGNVATKIASFNNEESAKEFEQFMAKFLEPWIKEDGADGT